jgi:hypothetical protein
MIRRAAEKSAFFWLIAVVVALGGCEKRDSAVPKATDVDNIERMISGKACYTPLNRWHREYYFPQSAGRVIRAWIYFSYQEAGIYGLRPGRVIIRLDNTYRVDDRPYDVASGRYEVTTHRLILDYCGPNLPEGGQRAATKTGG